MKQKILTILTLTLASAISTSAFAGPRGGAYINLSAGQYVSVSNLSPDTGCIGYAVEARQGPRRAALLEIRDGSPWYGEVSEDRWVSLRIGDGTWSGSGGGRFCGTRLLFEGDPASGSTTILSLDPLLHSGWLRFSTSSHRVDLTLAAQNLAPPAAYPYPGILLNPPVGPCSSAAVGTWGDAASLYRQDINSVGTVENAPFSSYNGLAREGSVGHPYTAGIVVGGATC